MEGKRVSIVGHLLDVKHDDDGLCFVCDGMGGNRVVQPTFRATQSRFKRVSGSLGVLLAIASLGLITGYILALYLSSSLYGLGM